jgi:cobalt-precorrin 5A hydrolase/precorrin-3B C17-methyltransferase
MGLSASAWPLLQRLKQGGYVDTLALTVQAASGLEEQPADLQIGRAADLLNEHWARSSTLIVIGALGAVTRLVAPLLTHKDQDPAVLVLDAHGRVVIPLLGSHTAGAEQQARELAAELGGEAVLTGDAASQGRLALDAFGEAWGWRRGGPTGAWHDLMIRQAGGETSTIRQSVGSQLWRQLPGAADHCCEAEDEAYADLTVTAEASPADGCRWHPACLWLGIGCERNTSPSLVLRAIDRALRQAGLAPEAVAGLSTITRKGDEPALLQITAEQGWPLQLFEPEALAAVEVPTPSPVVEAEMGTPSVAEAAALLAAGAEGRLVLAKSIEKPLGPEERGATTVAIALGGQPYAPQRGELHLIGSGPGDLSLLTADARRALARCAVWVGYGLYLDLLEPLRRSDQARLDGQLTREWERCAEALDLAQQGVKVALISSGESGIYGMAGLALELWLQQPEGHRPSFQVHPGISALQLAAARAGAPLMHDFCTISLSDRLTPWAVIERRLEGAAAGDFVVALYNPRSKGRDWQLARAIELLRTEREGSTPVVLARQLGRANETIQHTTLEALNPCDVDMLTVVLIGNSTTYAKAGRMVTPRGYPGASLS